MNQKQMETKYYKNINNHNTNSIIIIYLFIQFPARNIQLFRRAVCLLIILFLIRNPVCHNRNYNKESLNLIELNRNRKLLVRLLLFSRARAFAVGGTQPLRALIVGNRHTLLLRPYYEVILPLFSFIWLCHSRDSLSSQIDLGMSSLILLHKYLNSYQSDKLIFSNRLTLIIILFNKTINQLYIHISSIKLKIFGIKNGTGSATIFSFEI